MFDPIADMITIIRNGQASGKKLVYIIPSKFKHAILQYLVQKGYIVSFNNIDKKKTEIVLKYQESLPFIREIERISHVGGKVYLKSQNFKNSTRKVGQYVVSTSKGLMDTKEAQKKGLGGELIMRIW